MARVLHTIAYSEKRDLACEGEDQLYSVRDLNWMLERTLAEGEEKLTEWELEFVFKVRREILQGDTYFSPKQVRTVNKIYTEKTALGI